MSLNPLADLWGTAMLGCLLVAMINLLLTAVLMIARQSTLLTKLLASLGLLGFLGTAVGGAWYDLRHPPAATPAATPATTDEAGEPVADPAAEAEADTRGEADAATPADVADPAGAARDVPADTEAAADTETGADPEGDTDAEREGAEDGGKPATPAAAIEAADLPSDPEERRTAIRLVMRDVREVVRDRTRCADAQAVAEAWARLRGLPLDDYRNQIVALASQLDKCRTRVSWATAYAIRKSRMDARKEAADAVSKQLGEQAELNLFASLQGRDADQLRLGSKALTEAGVEEWMAGPLRGQLQDLGFSKVTFSDGSQTWRYTLEPTPHEALVAQALATHGLDRPLSLPSTE